MNIFAISRRPVLCAKALDDKRLNKMILETAQLLCSRFNIQAGEQITPYRTSHANHPITLWVLTDRNNARWLYQLGMAYGAEIEYRFGREHSCYRVIRELGETFRDLKQPVLPGIKLHNGARHKGLDLDFTHLPTPNAYRAYLNARWPGDKRKPTWTRRGPPSWYVG